MASDVQPIHDREVIDILPVTEAPQSPAMLPRPQGAPTALPAVDFEEATKRFGKEEVLHGLTFSVPWGQILGVIGPSGSGKTTTIRLLLGMYRPDSGSVRIFGREPTKLRRADRERIGYMPQDFVLYPTLTTEENLRFAASLYGMPWWETRHRIAQLLEFVNLTDARKRRAEDLSGGMRRRLSLAATLMHNPDFLVLDEPTAGIDPILRTSIWDGLRAARDEGKTMLVTTQYVTEAEYCDAVLLIDQGTIIAAGTPAELRRAATGGDILDVHFDAPHPDVVQRMQSLPFVRSIETLDHPTDVRVTVDDLSTDLPQLSEYCEREGGGCTGMEPYVPSFDDVFVRLVSRAREEWKDTADGDPHSTPIPPVAA